jgi:hypothetical protein
MKIDKYALKAGTDLTVFEFISEGTKGAIRKIILFQPTTEQNLFNLAFGDKDLLTGELNDMAVSNNGIRTRCLPLLWQHYMLSSTDIQMLSCMQQEALHHEHVCIELELRDFTKICSVIFTFMDKWATTFQNLSLIKNTAAS